MGGGGGEVAGRNSMMTKLRWILALHAIAGVIVVFYAIWSLFSNYVPSGHRGYHLLGSAVSILTWLWLWSVARRVWPVAERSVQPECRLNQIPVCVVLVTQGVLAAYALMAESPYWDGFPLVWAADFGLFTSLLIGGISWGLAGIRFSMATWLLSCGAAGAGIIGIGYVVGSRMMNAG